MAERKFRQHILKRGDAAKIRDEVAQEMRENIIQVSCDDKYFLQMSKIILTVEIKHNTVDRFRKFSV